MSGLMITPSIRPALVVQPNLQKLLKGIGDALADERAEAPKPRLSPVKMRKSAPAGGLLYTGSASTYKTQGTNFPLQPL